LGIIKTKMYFMTKSDYLTEKYLEVQIPTKCHIILVYNQIVD